MNTLSPPDKHQLEPRDAADARHPAVDVRHEQANHAIKEMVPTNLPRIGIVAVLLLVVSFAALLAGLFVLGHRPVAERQKRALEQAANVSNARPVVSVARPRRQASSSELSLPANVEAFQQTAIYSRSSGYVRRLLVDIGDRVQADQLLAELDTPEINAQLSQAKATVQQAEASLDKAQVDLKLAESTLHRYDDVALAGGVAQQELDEKRTQLDQARAGLNVAQANVEAARAQVQQLTALQGFARITAPFAGVITARNYDTGALLTPSNLSSTKPLFQMEQIDTLRVFVDVPQSYADSVKAGQQGQLQVRNFSGRSFSGAVVRSAGSIDASTRTLRVEIHVPNKDNLLYAGMYGQVRLQVTRDQQVLIVPASALVYNADGLSLATVQDGKVHFVKVTAGRDSGTEIEILDGLSGDDQVVTNPGEHIQENMLVDMVITTQPEKPTRKL
jgi:RND family efflux transporter MFP subunit